MALEARLVAAVNCHCDDEDPERDEDYRANEVSELSLRDVDDRRDLGLLHLREIRRIAG